MPDWAAAAAVLDAAVAGTFDADTIRALPRREGVSVNAPGAADPDRAEFEFAGSFELAPDALPTSRRPIGDQAGLREPASHQAVVTALAAGWPWMPKRKDHLAFGGVRWSIDDLFDDGSLRRVFYLNRVASAG